jgi:tRNA(Ser,Leu) C12 N-acetylase TAN1
MERESAAAARPDWNVVVTLPEPTFREASRLLRRWGRVRRTGFHNVLVMTVEEPRSFLAEFAAVLAEAPGLRNFVSHVVPADRVFDFREPAEFEARAREVALGWLPRLAGRSLMVRVRRRGLKGARSAQAEERALADAVLAALEVKGTPARVDLEDPDCTIQVETVGGRAGMSLWSREERRAFPFLGIA